jgi:hypothetical protein
MAIEAVLVFAFTGKISAQEFSDWLSRKDYTNKTLFLNTVRVVVSGRHGRFVVSEEAHRRGGTIIEDVVQHLDGYGGGPVTT